MQTLRVPLFPDKVCVEHGIRDVVPCPWPGCANGHSEDRFLGQLISDSIPPITYTRREWRSPLGGSYYTWDDDKMPNWFSAPKTRWNEARRLGLAGSNGPKLIYHYTNLEGLVGIVESRSLWLSDYSYLNDKTELMHGVEVVRELIREMRAAGPDAEVVELLECWERDLMEPAHRVCVASFSADDDSLSQWRSYGPIAIGIVPQQLTLHASQTNFGAVEYDRAMQRKLASVYLSHLTQAYQIDSRNERIVRVPDIYHRVDRLIELVAFFKDPAFRTEREYRLVYIEYAEALRALELQPPPKRFRVSRSKLLPYVASDELFPLPGDQRPLEIEEIVVGPETDELLERGVREFLASQSLDEVSVRRSTVPYRT